MSYFKDLDEYPRAELVAELQRRNYELWNGRCDYCGRSGLAKPCRFPDRHQAARKQAEFFGHRLCGKQHCQNVAKHTAHGSLTYYACDEHNDEIQRLVASE